MVLFIRIEIIWGEIRNFVWIWGEFETFVGGLGGNLRFKKGLSVEFEERFFEFGVDGD